MRMSNPFLDHLFQTKKLEGRKSNTGFSLIEILITLVIIGILAAIAAPNILGMINSNRVKKGLVDLSGAIQEAQSQATRESDSCTVTIDTADNEITGTCLLSTRNLNENLDIVANIANNGTANNFDITFSSKGTTTDAGTMFIIYMTNGTTKQSCFVVDSILGATRSGDYDVYPIDPADLNTNDCS